jgi:plastocyanin
MKIAALIALMLSGLVPALARSADADTSYGDGMVRVVIVKIGNFTFEPATVTVSAGTQIKWINQDDVPHTVTGTDAGSPLHSPAMDSDETYSIVASTTGTFKYFCAIHPHMVGTVVVE